MNALRIAPFCLRPSFDVRPWGVRNLAPVFNKTLAPDEDPIGEAWLTGDHCTVQEGEFRGKQFGELCKRFGRALVGDAPHSSDRFPLLLKFLFTQERLSVQVHPDDACARTVGEPCGKTECWYVVDARPEATIALGLKPGADTQQFRKAIDENRAEELLNWVPVQSKEMIYVDAGTVHTIGPGAVIFEVQQNSDLTYRLYDYGRPRELHLEQGIAALKEHTDAGKIQPVILQEGFERLIDTEYFCVDRHSFHGTREFRTRPGQTPRCLVALEGSATITGPDFDPVSLDPGKAVIVPACIGDFAVEAHSPLTLLSCAAAQV